ncbi:helix-turn-helix domain-containing protein [Kordia sp. YSTF-M3]|uniref:Helix-turn-helix domain-containing protein n=1 Tax=Kordia aestuariivivens TaxID=2759037 RepID=A0ABR7Q9N8_9FLAO|nr:helix-turn-helix domain-containing protein [Kordia aestuariivivens]MBC8755296.1 helix-turn-helix domain-containing protein [Kordia aestuariivivens]
MTQKFSYFFFLFLCFTAFLNAQEQQQNDSLAKYSYEELKELIDNNENENIESSKIYTLGYLLKAKKEANRLRMADAYYLLAVFNNDSLALKYSDSIISITKNIKGHKKFPAIGYYFKGYCLYTFGKNQEALDNYLKALKYLETNKNDRLELDTRMAIITLKSNWKEDDEILKYKESLVSFLYPLKKKNIHYRNRYLNALSNLSLTHIRIKNYNKSLLYTKKGILETIHTKDTLEYYKFVSNAGSAHYYLGNYDAVLDSLQKALPYEDDHGKAVNNYYLAKSYDKLKQPEKAQFHFLKTDSIYQATKDIFPEMRIAYEHIIDYYKSKNDVENQIKYYDRLIETDKIIDSTYTYVTETIQKKYETPQIIAERNRLLEEAQAKESSWKYSFGIISAVLLIISGVLVYAFRRQKYYKKRFEAVMNNSASLNNQKPRSEILEKHISTPLNVKNDLEIPASTVENILKGLSKFEASEGYTKQTTLGTLAKKLKTNPKYLSKVINKHYEKNFSSYLNELRVQYIITKLKSDSKFRNYTIKAIAEEAGFGNTESFSKAFYKNTGISPSYFVKQLSKRLESS